MNHTPEISIVIPAYNEELNIAPLFQRIERVLSESGRRYEVIIVNDASTDGTRDVLDKIYQQHKCVAVVTHFFCQGKAAALEHGFELVRGRYIVIIDADLQQEPEDIPRLIAALDQGYDVVSGKRVNRDDAVLKRLSSRIFNMVMRRMTGLKIDDYFSGLKAFRTNVIRFLSLYGDLYRFAAVFAFKNGFKVAEIDCAHHPRHQGTSKYSSLGRLRLALRDLATVLFSVTLNRRRVYLLGVAGIVLLSAGVTLLFAAWLAAVCDPRLLGGPAAIIGSGCLFLGAQLRLLTSLADRFFSMHQEELQYRRRNIRQILKVRDGEAEAQRGEG